MIAGSGGMPVDVAVVGAGPAGLAAAVSCAEAGLATVALDPDPDRAWPQTFGAWADELPAGTPVAARWEDVAVVTDSASLVLDRPYVLLDNAALQRDLRARFAAAAGEVRAAQVQSWAPPGGEAGGRHAVGHDRGEVLLARAVVDASGHRPVLVAAPSVDDAPVQAAYGIVARFDRPPAQPGAMTLMDFSTAHLTGAPVMPSFLYAMDLGKRRWLVEETSLAARPALPMAELERRLHARLAHRDATTPVIEHIERVAFPMGVRVPDRRQPVVGFGAAAGMVHPATGYSVARALRTAPELAVALRRAIEENAPAAAVARAGWSAVWPPAVLRQRHLHDLGLSTLLTLDATQIQQFFEVFFTAPQVDWRGYLSGAPSSGAVLMTMLRLFLRAPGPVRQRMVAAALRSAVRGSQPASSR